MATAEHLTPDEARALWLEQRRKSVGGSDAAGILNLSPFVTPLSVYMDKVGCLPPREEPRYLAWGLRFQPAIAQIYTEETGRELSVPPAIVWHPEAPWMHASMDYLAADRPVEIKRVSRYYTKDWGPSGTDQVPIYYRIQVNQQMACAGYQAADIAAFIGWDELRIYTVERDDELITRLVQVEREFMGRVERRDPPLPDFQHPSTLEILRLIEPEAGKVATDFDEDRAALLADEYEFMGGVERKAKAVRDTAKAELLHLLGNAEVGYLPDGRTLRRKKVERSGYTVAPSSYVDFKILKPKGMVTDGASRDRIATDEDRPAGPAIQANLRE